MKNAINNRKSLISYAIIIILISALSSFVILNFADEQLSFISQSMLQDVAIEQQIEIDLQFISAEQSVLSLANSISQFHDSERSLITYLSEQNAFLDFDNLYYLNLEGRGLSQTGRLSDFSDKISIENHSIHRAKLTVPYISETTKHNVIGFYTLVFDEKDVPIGFVYAEYSLRNITLRLNDVMFADGYTIICDNQGKEIYSTDDSYVTYSELPSAYLKHELTFADIQKDFAQGNSGSIAFVLNSVDMLAVYSPLDYNGWTLVFVVDESSVAVDTKLFVHILIVFVILIIVGLLLFALYFFQAKKTMERIAYYDDLTGLPNLSKFKEEISSTLRANPTERFVAVKFDVDNFKVINEIYSFEVGNKVIRAFSKTGSTVTEKTFILARVGVDEFMMFAGNGFLDRLEDLTEHYEDYFKKSIPELEKHHLTFSYGRYFIELGETNANDIVTKTSMAHSIAKSKKDSVIWNYDDAYKNQLLKLTTISNKMELALKENQLTPFLQPKVNLDNDKVIGAEALVRWIEPDGNMIYPNEFIPLCESNGFITEIDKHILSEVCKTLRNWIDNGLEIVPVSVNFSRIHLNNPNFYQDIVKIVDSFDIPHKYIEIEFTETTISNNENSAEQLFDNLRKSNFKVSIDDFGVGHSSLGMLKNFNVDTLKLDRSFFLDNVQGGNGERVIDGIIKLAHSINMNVVAEGIEDIEQINFLRSINCESVQGYFFAKPMPVTDFTNNYLTYTK